METSQPQESKEVERVSQSNGVPTHRTPLPAQPEMSPDSEKDVTLLPLHPRATDEIRQYVNEFATTLLLQSKLLAYKKRHDEVLRTDVEEAFDAINQERNTAWSRNFAIAVGGAFFGAFVAGFLTELSAPAGPRATWIAVYVVLGFIGISLIFWGLRR